MNNRIKVLQVIASTVLGGAPESVRLIAAYSDKEDFEIEIATTNDGPHFVRYKQLGLRIHPINIFGRSRVNPRPAFELKKLFKDGCYDVIHLHGTRAGFWGAIAAGGLGIPTIYTERSYAFSAGRKYLSGKFFEKVERYIGNHTDRLITVSCEDASLAENLALAPRENIVIIKNGVEYKRFSCRIDTEEIQRLRQELGIPDDSKVIGTVGRLIYQKDPDNFLDIASALKTKYPKIVFLWVGNGDLSQKTASRIKKHQMTNVILTGSRDDIPELLNLMDVFLLTSRWEGLPLAALEAMGAGLPVVGTSIRGIKELVKHGESGFLFTPFNVEAASEYLLKILDNDDLQIRLGATGQKILEEELNVSKMVRAYEQLYRELAQKERVVL